VFAQEPTRDSTSSLGGETPIKPGQVSSDAQWSKLPAVRDQVREPELQLQVDTAWVEYMTNGFANAEAMFRQTLKAYMRPYYITIGMYVVLFVVGIGFFVAAALVGIYTDKSVVAVAFGGLSVASFLTFFVRQPLHELELNLEFITWLGVTFNTYWARLMYMLDTATIQADLKAAGDDYADMVERLIEKHASLRAEESAGAASTRRGTPSSPRGPDAHGPDEEQLSGTTATQAEPGQLSNQVG
jgi:hypothetical protein